MSSAPAGLDVREYTYGMFTFDHSGDHNPRFFSARKSWWVTRIQYFTPPVDSGALRMPGAASILVAPSGCVVLEPNGAHKGWIGIENAGTIIIEFWFQTPANQHNLVLPVDVTNTQPPGL